VTVDNGTPHGARNEERMFTAAVPSPATETFALNMNGVVKRYPGVTALKGVSFSVRPGEVHAIVGENGAGKSTLMAIASGAETADAGTVEIGGQRLRGGSPREALRLGLAIVYQHSSLTPDLTIEENLVVGVAPGKRPPVLRRGQWVREQLAAAGSELHPHTRVDSLTPAERQLTEISKAVASEAKVLVLDEPTESLTAHETQSLFDYIRQTTARGTAVVYISHRLADVKTIADRITVLRDGQTRGTSNADEISEQEILQLVVGRAVDSAFPPKAPQLSEEVVLRVEDFSSGRARGVTLTAHQGEILGLAGIDGNGQQDVIRGLAGLQPSRGAVRLRGAALDVSSPIRAARSGISHLPADRHADGLFLSMSLRENLSALVLPGMSKLGVMKPKAERTYAKSQAGQVGAKISSIEQPASTLSGGNQQKILLGRVLSVGADVLLAAEPTRGVDVGSRLEIYQTMRKLVAEGKTVIVMSSDAMELEGLCDRVIVFSRGRSVRTLVGGEVTEEAITGTALGATMDEAVDLTSRAGSKQTHGPKPRSAIDAATRTRGPAPGQGAASRFLGGDYLPPLLLAALCVGFSLYTYGHDPLFLGQRSVSASLLLLNPLLLAGLAQLLAIAVGGIDLSVGSVMSMTVTTMSYYAHTGQSWQSFDTGIVVSLALAAAVGLVNAALIIYARFAPVLATLITYIAVQGLSYIIRSTPQGNINSVISADLSRSFGWVPLFTIVCVVLVVLAELALRWTVTGIKLRAVGSDAVRALRLGVSVNRVVAGTYVLSALISALAGVLLYSVVGIGDATAGQNYLLLSISAVVLGGASIYGGRASFVGTLFGALLLELVVASIPFLNIQPAWQSILPGLMIVVGAGIYTKARGRHAHGGTA